MTYSGINLTKVVKYVYTENYKVLLKEMKEDTNKWEDLCVHGLKDLVKMLILLQMIYRFNS